MEEMKDNVIDINDQKKIKLTNGEIFNFISLMNPARASFDKLQKLSIVSGKTQYWMYKLWKKLSDLYNDVEKVRQDLLKEYAKKDEKDEVVIVNGNATFTDEGMKEFQAAYAELIAVENEIPFLKIKVDSALLEKMNNTAKSPSEAIVLADMVNLEKIINFVE
jgi:hypothetical protein